MRLCTPFNVLAALWLVTWSVEGALMLWSKRQPSTLHLMSNETRMHGLRMLERAVKEDAAKPPECMGLVKELCKPCPEGGPKDFCERVHDKCRELFCSPFCRRNIWKCNIEFGDFSEETGNDRYEQALCGQFVAEGCSTLLDCCADDDALMEYVENWAYFDRFPDPYYPTPGCEKGPNADLCSKCKGAVKVKAALLDAPCPYPDIDGTKPSAAGEDKMRAGGFFLEVQQRRRRTLRAARKAKPLPAANTAFVQLASRITPGYKDGEWPGPPAHKSELERCNKLKAKIEGKLSSMEAKFQDNVCQCMGCCEGACFRPVTEQFPAGDVWGGKESIADMD